MAGIGVSYISGGIIYSVQNFGGLTIERTLNDLGASTVSIPNASANDLANLTAGVELKISALTHVLNGYAKTVSRQDSNNGLQVLGASYGIALTDTYADAADAYGNMDASSSGRVIVWKSKTPGQIINGTTGADGILKNSPLTAGTINPAGTAGNQRFDSTKKLDLIKKMAQYGATEWLDKDDKTLDFGNRVGLDVSVKTYQRGANCTVLNQSDNDAAGNVWKITVLGRGSGVTQISGSATAVGYARTNPLKNKERVFVNNNITDAAVAAAFAQALLDQLSGNAYKTYTIQPSNWTDNVQIGDRLTFIDSSGTSHDMRCQHWKLVMVGMTAATLTLALIEEGNRMSGNTSLKNLLDKYGGLTEIQGSSSQEKNVLIGPVSLNCSDTAPSRVSISLPTDAQTILSAKLYLTRQSLTYSTDSATAGGTQNTSDAGHSGHLIGSYSTSGAGGASKVTDSGVITGGPFSWGNSFVAGNSYTADATHTAGMDIYFWAEYTGASSTTLAEVYATDGVSYFPSSTGALCAIGSDATGSISVFSGTIHVPTDTSNTSYTLYVRLVSGGSETWSIMNSVWVTYAQHTHPTTGTSGTGTAVITNPSHTNPITQGVYVPGGEANKTIGYKFNGGAESTIANFAVNGDSGEIDVTSAITTAAAQYLDVRPTAGGAQAKLTASLKITYI